LVVAAEFSEPVNAWRGIPQTFECTEWLDFNPGSEKRVWITTAFAHPVATATLAPGHGAAHARFMSRYSHLAVLSAMVHDETRGSVEPHGDHGVAIDYWPDAGDRAQLRLGAWAAAKLLFEAGAERVVVPREPPITLERGESVDSLRNLPIEPGPLVLTSTHPMGSVPIHDDPERGAVSSTGKHHHVAGLWVADASVFPSSIGVAPQLSTYAFGLRSARALVRAG
jgi:choline dehydrogenase-like flavoprotein